MFSSMQNEMTEAMRELHAKQEEITGAFDRLQDITASAMSKDRAIKATVDGQGKLTELAFNGKRWRDMAPKELGAKIVEVVQDAQQQAATSVAEAMAGLVPNSMDLERLRASGPDLEAMFTAAIEDAGRLGR